jgi:drug/metabolite transporter (DMT)-like permease
LFSAGGAARERYARRVPRPRGYLPLLLFLSALWGASYLFIKVAVEEIEPAAMIELRLVLAGAVLLAYLVYRVGGRRALAELRATGRDGLILGILNGAIPFTLIAWGEKHVDSGVAAIANSVVPIFVALLAIRFRPSERSTGLRLVGIFVGLAGVGVLAGFHPKGGWWAVAGTMAVVVASLSYAAANLFTQERFAETSPLTTATAAILWGLVVLAPFAAFQIPGSVPSAKALASVAALGVLGTAIASLVLYRMLVTYGSARTTLVTYLLPAFALVYGAAFLDEKVTVNALLGLALILGGIALGSGVLRPGRRREPVGAAQGP